MLTGITNPSTAKWSLYGTDASGNLVVLISDFYNSVTKYFAVERVR